VVAEARKRLRGTGSLQVLDVKQLQAQRMGGVLGVARFGQAPRFLKMTYAPSGAASRSRRGKGVVFDPVVSR
jgi:leucyl aminopeptidase